MPKGIYIRTEGYKNKLSNRLAEYNRDNNKFRKQNSKCHKVSEITRNKISVTRKNKPLSEKNKIGISIGNKKRWDKTNYFIKLYNTRGLKFVNDTLLNKMIIFIIKIIKRIALQ